jgi:hypothetical protein
MRLHCLKLKHRLENDLLLIKLPVHPSTIEELALIRFWLLKLSQTYFEELNANHGILNPEFLSVLNPRTGPRKILFHANDVTCGEADIKIILFHTNGVEFRERIKAAIPADFAQFLCARRMTLQTSLHDEPHNLFKFITGTGNTLKYFCILTIGLKQREFCELLVKVVNFGNSFL